jgi:hypothetical protein
MTIKGGLNKSDNAVHISFSIAGGRTYTRAFNDTVSSELANFEMIADTLDNIDKHDTQLYLRQLRVLFQHAHVDILAGDSVFQTNYNIWMIDRYVRMLLQSKDMKLIAELLNLDGILYSVYQAGTLDDQYIDVGFKMPKLDIQAKKINIVAAKADTPNAIIEALNANIKSLISFMHANKKALTKIYSAIVDTAKSHLG